MPAFDYQCQLTSRLLFPWNTCPLSRGIFTDKLRRTGDHLKPVKKLLAHTVGRIWHAKCFAPEIIASS